MKGDVGSSSSRSSCSYSLPLLNMGMLAHLSRNGLSMLAGRAADGAGPFQSQEDDLHKLTGDECWRLILELGTQWPTWTGAAAPSQVTTQVLKKEKKPPQDVLELIATRALEALAQTPPRLYGKNAQVSKGMLTPKQTTQEVMDSKTAIVTEPAVPAPSSSLEVLPSRTSTRPRTAALTIFYDGIVNVSDNIPADKARLIMTFAEKAAVSLNAQALLRNMKCVMPQRLDDLQHSTTTSTNSTTLDQQEPAATSSNSESPSPVTPFKPFKFTFEPGYSLRHVTVKPLPNARKNSLARYLDKRKRSRGTSSCSSEGGSPKKQVLGDHKEFYTTGKYPLPSSCQDSYMCANCFTASGQAPTSDAEMDSLVE